MAVKTKHAEVEEEERTERHPTEHGTHRTANPEAANPEAPTAATMSTGGEGPGIPTLFAGLPGTSGGFKILPGYPMAVGAKRESIAIHYGPASYATVVTGATPSGGDTLRASEFGLKYLEDVNPAVSTDGLYWVDYVSPPGVSTPASVILIWTLAATGAQVTAGTNLSASGVRVRGRGHGG
jgi:hypothetical protein